MADEPIYATLAEVRADPGIPDDTGDLSDAALTELVLDAEDRIDGKLGGWPIAISTGRKILAPGPIPTTDFPRPPTQPWQWAKLKRATIKLVAFAYANPEQFRPRQWNAISGPDFSMSQPTDPDGVEPVFPDTVILLLNQSKLRRVLGHAIT